MVLMDGSENRSNRRNGEDSVPVQQTEAAKISVVGLCDNDVAAPLNAIRTSEGETDRLDSWEACNMADLEAVGGEISSSAISNRSNSRKRFRNVAEDDDFLFPCHGSYTPGENLSCSELQLEYMKPVIDIVNGSVMIPLDVVDRGRIPYSRTLYGYFIQEKKIDFSLIDSHCRNMWKAHGIEDIMVNDKGFYFFKFSTDEGMLHALEHGPWTINNTPIFLKRWSPGLILDKSKQDKLKIPVWIRIYDMPLEIWNKKGLTIIASMLGNPLAIDSCTARMCMNASGRAGYARVLVDFEANANWPDEISVSVPNGNGYSLSTLRVEYTWKPASCSLSNVFDQTDCIPIQQIDMVKDQDNQHNELGLKKEQEEREDERRYKAHPHLFSIIKVACDEDLSKQIGKDIHFDLVNHNKVRSFYVKKQMPFNIFKEEVAKEFGIPVRYQRFWIWEQRENYTYRPNRPLTAHEETQSVETLGEISNRNHYGELKLFLEIEIGPDMHPVVPPYKSKNDILVFFKLYDPEKEQLRYVGRLFVKSSSKPTEIISKLNERAGFSPDEEIELYDEIKSEPCVLCERVDKKTSFRSSEIEDGDIICFQKLSQAQAVDKYRYPDVPSFLEYVKSCEELKTLKVSFHHATKQEPVIYNIRLPKQSTVGDVLNEIKIKVKLSHPDAELRLLEVFYHKIYKIFPLTEKIENINDQYWTLRAEEVPEEEKNLGPQDRLIHVYHFTKEEMQVQNIGEPFFLVIHEKETLAAVKVRIQNKLQVPDDKYSKWKFAFVSLGGPEYLQDSDVVSSFFQRGAIFGDWELYLGLEHSDTTP